MHDHRTQLATLIASRICHDLISPVGAISNGLELVQLAGQLGEGPELNLISESCESAGARIRFFRIAFGAANDRSQVSAQDASTILRDLSHGSRLSYVWDHTGDASRSEVQLAFLAVQCAEVALPRGGTITVQLAPSHITVTAQGERIEQNPEIWHHLRGPSDAQGVMGEKIDIAPAHVQFALLPLLAADKGRRPHVVQGDDALILTV